MTTPNPTARSRELSLDLVEDHKWMDCPHYEGCLSHAVNQRWRAFECCQCAFYLAQSLVAAQCRATKT